MRTKTRRSSSAHEERRRGAVVSATLPTHGRLRRLVDGPGTMLARQAAASARTPWYVTWCARGGGTRAASFSRMESDMTRKRFGLSQDHRTRYALISQGYKLILDIASGNTELYEPGSDPQELLDLSATEIDTAEKLRQQLLSLISENEELRAQLSQNDAGEQIDVLTEDEVDDLKSIGCLR